MTSKDRVISELGREIGRTLIACIREDLDTPFDLNGVRYMLDQSYLDGTLVEDLIQGFRHGVRQGMQDPINPSPEYLKILCRVRDWDPDE